MGEPQPERYLVQLAEWREALDAAVSRYTTPRTVQLVDSPGALLVKVAPDREGQETAAQLVAWCEPSLALFCPPDEDDSFFTVVLMGSKGDNVTLVCGELNPAESSGLIDVELSDNPPDPDLVAEVFEAVTAVLDQMASSGDWHPFSPTNDEYRELHEIFNSAFPEFETLPEDKYLSASEKERWNTILQLVYVGSIRYEIKRRRHEQRELHRDRLSIHADEIAEDLLDRPIGRRLKLTTQPERQDLIYKELVKDDPCITKKSCLPVARAIKTVLLRRSIQNSTADPATTHE